MPFWNSPDVTADSGEPTGLPTRAYPSYTAPGMHHTVKLRYGVDNPGPLQCIRHFKNTSTLYVRLLTQPYNTLVLQNAHRIKLSILALAWERNFGRGSCRALQLAIYFESRFQYSLLTFILLAIELRTDSNCYKTARHAVELQQGYAAWYHNCALKSSLRNTLTTTMTNSLYVQIFRPAVNISQA